MTNARKENKVYTWNPINAIQEGRPKIGWEGNIVNLGRPNFLHEGSLI